MNKCNYVNKAAQCLRDIARYVQVILYKHLFKKMFKQPQSRFIVIQK